MIAVDLFAGWGGFTTGATQAGATVAYAANHWPLAVQAHAANHPETEHVCQDLRQADWTQLPEHDLLLASPACQGHSQAANGARARNTGVQAKHAALRATAWAVVDCVEVCRPRVLLVENVPSFRRWGPTDENGRPIKDRAGEYFDHWKEGLAMRGYHLDIRTIRASHHGVPQRRDRLFIIGTLGGIKVPKLVKGAEPAFGPCIDWDAPATWRRWADKPRVRERVLRSRARHGRRFLTQHTRDHMGVGLDEPIRTITGGDQWAVVDGDHYRSLTLRETARAMGFPEDYQWPAEANRGDVVLGFGNAVCPGPARALVSAVMRAAA